MKTVATCPNAKEIKAGNANVPPRYDCRVCMKYRSAYGSEQCGEDKARQQAIDDGQRDFIRNCGRGRDA